MSEDAPVNTGAVNWPDADSAYFTVRRMQTKLHHWATQEPGRRFGDLHTGTAKSESGHETALSDCWGE